MGALEANGESPRILVVDDEADIRTSMELILGDEGFKIQTARTGAEAQNILLSGAPDLVISDIQLPDLDGTTLLSWIRARRIAVPVILITGMPGRATVERAVDQEASGYLVKPIRRVALLEAIGRALYRRVRLDDDPDLIASISRRHPDNESGGAQTLLATLEPLDLTEVLDGLVPFCLTDESGGILAANRQFETLTRRSAQDLVGTDLRTLLGKEEDIYEFSSAQARHMARRSEMALRRGIGGNIQVDVVVSPVGRAHGTRRFIFSARDLTEYNRKKDHLEFLAYHDPLTGLLNRSGFERELKRELARALDRKGSLAVMLLDIDGFRDVTDRSGYAAGDALLQQAAHRMQRTGGDRLVLGRLSADMFMVVARDVDDRAETEEIARDLVRVLGQLTKGDYLETGVTACVGVTLFPDDGTEIERLLGNADSARARAKKRGKAKVCFYESRFTEQVRQSLQMEDHLHRALRQGLFELHYQPIVDARTGSVGAVEALVRQRNEDGSIVSPESFIPIAESSGLIVPLGEWILRKAALDVARIQKETGKHFRLAVNVSAVQLEHGNLEELLPRILKEAGLSPESFEIEITETIMMDIAGRAFGALSLFRDQGIGISMDDFGTGFSSLAYLKKFQVNRIKVDRTFVRGITEGGVDASIARAVNDMARGLGIPTVGEGVETKEQARILTDLGCQELQGFLFSRPLPLEALRPFLLHPDNQGGRAAH